MYVSVTFLWFPQNVTFLWFPQMLLFCGFPKGNKGVFRTTSDRGWNFFLGLWIPYGYPKFSDPLQNWRRLPLISLHYCYATYSVVAAFYTPFWHQNRQLFICSFRSLHYFYVTYFVVAAFHAHLWHQNRK